MKELRQAMLGILMAGIFVALLVGSLSASLVDEQVTLALLAKGMQPGESVFVPIFEEITNALGTPVAPGQVGTEQAPQPELVETGEPAPGIHCEYPAGWQTIIIQPDDTLASLAHTYYTNREALREGNCLPVDTLPVGYEFRVPVVSIVQTTNAVSTAVRCGPPPGWVIYYVRPNDTLYYLSSVLGVSFWQLQNANCLSTSYIYVGQALYVPFYPPIRPLPTLPPVNTPTPTFMLPTFTAQPPTWTPNPTTPPVTSEPTVTVAIPTPTEGPYPPPASPTPEVPPTNTEIPPSFEPPTSTPIPVPSITPIPFPIISPYPPPLPGL